MERATQGRDGTDLGWLRLDGLDEERVERVPLDNSLLGRKVPEKSGDFPVRNTASNSIDFRGFPAENGDFFSSFRPVSEGGIIDLSQTD